MEDRYLFRGKRIDNGEWVTGNLIQSSDAEDGWEAIIIPVKNSNMFAEHIENDYSTMFTKPIERGYGNLGFENWYRVDSSTICQCTGLEDKHGELIWENDIMVAHLDDSYPEDKTYAKILWHENGFYAIENGSEDISPIDIFDQEHFEVCGNIFDNAELLESEG